MSQGRAPTNRRVEIEGAHNLRDLGGIDASGGKRIRRGRIFRSGTLDRLTPAGVERLLSLGIKTVFDLRSGPERDHSPTRWLADSGLGRWQLAASESLGDPKPLLEQSLHSAGRTRAMMTTVYRSLPRDHRQSYSALFQALACDDLPVLFHCSAGKDRTGVATALLLSLLGVDRDQIDDDYLATNAVIDTTIEMFLSDPRNALAAAAPAAVWKPMMNADRVYLDAMFCAVDQAYGSVEAYARDELSLSSADLAQLRGRLLE